MLYLKHLILWYNRLMHKPEFKTKFQLMILINLTLKMHKLTKILTMIEEQQKKFLRVLNQHNRFKRLKSLKKINLSRILICKLSRKQTF
jgi:hypothetical protein